MAAKPHRDYVVHCPPTAAYGGRHGQAASGMARAQGCLSDGCRRALGVVLVILVAAALVAAVILLVIFLSNKFPEKDPRYSVAVAGVAGLDPARDVSPAAGGRDALSPVFNVTLRVDNTRNVFDAACVPRLSSATVSYGDAFLGRGTVPAFCARQRRAGERLARAWGQGVLVPGFLRDQLAAELAVGEATVDVQVTLPPADCYMCYDKMLVCKAKIGGGFSPCLVMDRPSPPAVGSTIVVVD